MAEVDRPIDETWRDVLTRSAPTTASLRMLHGFLNLVEPKGVVAGTLYLEVPNELTAACSKQRIRVPLLDARSATLPTRGHRTSRRRQPRASSRTTQQPAIRRRSSPANEVETPATPQSVFETPRPSAAATPG